MFHLARTAILALILVCCAVSVSAQEYVVVPNDTWIHQEPSEESPRFQPGRGNGYYTAEKIGADRSWTKVRFNDVPSTKRCYGQLWSLNRIRVDVWVRTADLAPVTTKKVTARYDDGTSLTLNPGVVVTPRKKDGWYDARTAGYRWPAELDSAMVGTVFNPSPTFKHQPGTYRVARNNLIVAGEPIPKTKGSGVRIRREIENDGVLRYLLGWQCAEVTVLGEFDDPKKGAGGMGLLGALSGGTASFVPKGSDVYWNGKKLGETLQDYTVTDVKERGDRVCTSAGEGMPSGPLELCFDADLLQKRESRLGLADALSDSGTKKIGAVLRKSKGVGLQSKGISPAVTSRILSQRRSALNACFDEASKKVGPSLRGTVKVEFDVDEAGAVTRSKLVSSSLDHDEAERCMLDVIDGLIFPAREGRELHTVTRTFQFPDPT